MLEATVGWLGTLMSANPKKALGLLLTESFEGTTMPNGQKYEDWIKGKGHEATGGE
jgi:hypothetical protein